MHLFLDLIAKEHQKIDLKTYLSHLNSRNIIEKPDSFSRAEQRFLRATLNCQKSSDMIKGGWLYKGCNELYN